VQIVKAKQLPKVQHSKFFTRALERETMEYNYLLPKKKEEEEEGEMLIFLCLFFLTERPFI